MSRIKWGRIDGDGIYTMVDPPDFLRHYTIQVLRYHRKGRRVYVPKVRCACGQVEFGATFKTPRDAKGGALYEANHLFQQHTCHATQAEQEKQLGSGAPESLDAALHRLTTSTRYLREHLAALGREPAGTVAVSCDCPIYRWLRAAGIPLQKVDGWWYIETEGGTIWHYSPPTWLRWLQQEMDRMPDGAITGLQALGLLDKVVQKAQHDANLSQVAKARLRG